MFEGRRGRKGRRGRASLSPVLFVLSVLFVLFAPVARAKTTTVILHTVKDLTDYDRERLADEGVVVLHALPGGRYLARLAENAGAAGDERISSIEPLAPGKKIHPTARRAAASGNASMKASVIFQSDVTFAEARDAILAAGGSLDAFTFKFLPVQRIEATIPSQSLMALAADETVLAIVGPRKLKVASDNAATARLSKVDVVQAAPYGLTGDGVTVSLFELGAGQASHIELEGRVTLPASTAGGGTVDKLHATHVTGTIAAAGIKPDAKGMAPKAHVFQFCVRKDSNQCTGEWLERKEDDLAPLGITADNNSWSYSWGWWEDSDYERTVWSGTDGNWGAYDLALSSPIDKIANDKDILFVHSAGNDGTPPSALLSDEWRSHNHVDDDLNEIRGQRHCLSKNGSGTDCPASCNATSDRCELTLHHPTPFDTVSTTASAKNVVAVGAVTHTGAIADFSSRGPAKDGRVKPDLVARGVAVHSTVPTNLYANLSGTSMAAPAVTGITALLTEQWKRSYGTRPSAAALKALLIAGADDLGNPGPDYTYGFGLVNAKSSVDLILADQGQQGRRIRTLSFASGQQQQHEFAAVVDQTQNLRVVLNWPDPYIPYIPGGEDVAPKALINDLDLKVIDPAGNTILPWALNKNEPNANAVRGVNTVDNIEMVEIANATPGAYRVIATGTSVPEGPQRAVLVTNARTARPCVDVQELSRSNDTAANASGNLAAGQLVAAGLCSSTDVDFYKFTVTKTGPVSVTITTGDTPLRATLTGTGISRTQDIPANTTATLTATASTVPNVVTLEIEATGALGEEPQYTFIPSFLQKLQPKRRIVRR